MVSNNPNKFIMRSFWLTLIFLISIVNLFAGDIYKTTSELKFRKEPNSHSHAYGTIKSGEEVIVIDKTDSEWFKIEHGGKTGYLSSKYLTLIRAEAKKEVPKPVEVKTEEKSSSATIWIIAGALILLYIIIKANKKTPEKEKQVKREIPKIKVTISSSKDNSVIDVSGKYVNISQHTGFTKGPAIPLWNHKYVYSYSEINGATKDQQQFYIIFKNAFLSSKYFDLEGNTNYAFILLFDLLNDYDKHLSLSTLENQLKTLGTFYPKTKSYGTNFLIEKMEKAGDTEGVKRLSGITSNNYSTNYSNYFEDWQLGNRYKKELNLKDNEIKILNTLIDTDNKFNSIKYCATNLIHIFLHTVNEIEAILKKDNTSIHEQANAIAVIEIAKHYRYRNGSYNYKSAYEVFINNIHQTIYKLCENKLRDHFNVGRKTDLNWYIHSEQALAEFKIKFQDHIDKILIEQIGKLKAPDLETEIALNEYTKTRWKNKIEELEATFDEKKIADYVKEVYSLEKANTLNPSIENIFYQASKFISKYDKITALKFYVDYLYYDLKSVKFDNKQLTKTIQKSLFKTNEQLNDFEIIVSDLIKDKNRDKAVKAVAALYTTKRKKIQLDSSVIKEVHEKHSDTVELLNEYLQDEIEEENSSIKANEINKEEVKIKIKTQDVETPHLSNKLGLNINQMELLDLLSKNSFTISQQQLVSFAKAKGVLKNQLVESINETCFETIDDILIEEDGENYIINENYYQQIFAQ
jgi:hypothetical protein